MYSAFFALIWVLAKGHRNFNSFPDTADSTTPFELNQYRDGDPGKYGAQ